MRDNPLSNEQQEAFLTLAEHLAALERRVAEQIPRTLTYWILEGHTPRPTNNVLVWGRWFETTDRHVALTALTPAITVSTVFLGVDHNFLHEGAPILYETMVFGLPDAEELMQRYETWDAAEVGHRAICVQVLCVLGIAPGWGSRAGVPAGFPHELDPRDWAPRAAAAPQTGFVCEQCFDAPAVRTIAAPWGGEMGVCQGCSQKEESDAREM